MKRLKLLGLFAVVSMLACGSNSAPSQTPPTQTPPLIAVTSSPSLNQVPPDQLKIVEYQVPSGSGPHDVAPAPDGTVWYTAQAAGALGRLDPATGMTTQVALGAGSAPHGVIVGPDGAAWVTDGGLNAIIKVDPVSLVVTRFPLPAGSRNANLNTAAFDSAGVLWFTGQAGFYGKVDPAQGAVELFQAPGGPGPYGITATSTGDVYYASLAGSHIGKLNTTQATVRRLSPPTANQGARRVWSDSRGRIWISEWNAGQLALYDPSSNSWSEWKLPGSSPMAYAVYVDAQDIVWLSDFGANALVRFDPGNEQFTVMALPSANANVRQILGRPGEIWAAESGVDKLILIRTTSLP
jgi:virginiamycin B lyase